MTATTSTINDSISQPRKQRENPNHATQIDSKTPDTIFVTNKTCVAEKLSTSDSSARVNSKQEIESNGLKRVNGKAVNKQLGTVDINRDTGDIKHSQIQATNRPKSSGTMQDAPSKLEPISKNVSGIIKNIRTFLKF